MFGRKTIVVRLDAEWLALLDEEVERKDSTRGALIRQMIRARYAPKIKPGPGPYYYDETADV